MELLVRMRNGLPDFFIRLTNWGAPGTGTPSWTSTPSMSVSQLSIALRSVMSGPSASRGCRAAVLGADVPDRQRTEPVPGATGGALLDQLADHRDEPRVGARRARPRVAQTQVGGGLLGLVVEIPEHLEVIGDEADRAD